MIIFKELIEMDFEGYEYEIFYILIIELLYKTPFFYENLKIANF